jgi:LysR family transcriptional regulator, low CO2-responsive transcriptional regulator
VTLSQLQSFAAIARLGSVKAAAHELGVSEPTVSQAATALRQELGDELYVRRDGGIHLTPGGRRLATAAAEILGLADQARRGVREARGEVATLRVAASAGVAELAAPPLLKAFARRNAGVEVRLQVARGGSIARLLSDRVVDVVLGPRPRGDSAFGIESIPFLRYGLVVVAAPEHPLAGDRDIAPAALAGEPWLTGPSGAEPSTTTGAFFAREGLAPGNVRAFPTHAAARGQVVAGQGVMLVIAHAVLGELERGELVALDVRGTPAERLWYASMLGPDRRPPAAWALRRFVATPEATQAMLARSAERFRPSIHVSLWS